MADDASALTNRILLRHAENKSKAKSWLTASLGSSSEETPDLHPPSSSLSQGQDPELASWEYGDENSGIGSAKRTGDGEVSTNLQLLSANEALRRRLLSKDAYKKYSSSQNQGRNRPGAGGSGETTHRVGTVKKRSLDDDEDGEEIKGRSSLGRIQRHQNQQQNNNIVKVPQDKNDPDSGSFHATSTPGRTDPTPPAVQSPDAGAASLGMRKRARPGSSYLDQVLSKRQQKKQK